MRAYDPLVFTVTLHTINLFTYRSVSRHSADLGIEPGPLGSLFLTHLAIQGVDDEDECVTVT